LVKGDHFFVEMLKGLEKIGRKVEEGCAFCVALFNNNFFCEWTTKSLSCLRLCGSGGETRIDSDGVSIFYLA
jgi:hypothetical protein